MHNLSRIKELTLILTDQCNLSCAYCNQSKPLTSISIKHLKDALSFLYNNFNNKCLLKFFGGEPTLEEDKIFAVLEFIRIANNNGKKYKWELITNGVLLKNMINKLLRYSDSCNKITISLDSLTHDGNSNRVGLCEDSLSEILSILPKLYDNFNLEFRVTVSHSNIDHVVEFIDSIFLKYKNAIVRIKPAIGFVDIDKYNLIDFTKFNDKSFIFFSVKLNEFIDFKKQHKSEDRCCPDKCMSGIERVILATDGMLYPCTEFYYLTPYSLGFPNNNFYENRRRFINETKKL